MASASLAISMIASGVGAGASCNWPPTRELRTSARRLVEGTWGSWNRVPRQRPGSAIYRAIASSMCSMRVKTSGPSALTSTFSSEPAGLLEDPGCPANVSMAKCMFSLISAG